jgi:hypothetical protein
MRSRRNSLIVEMFVGKTVTSTCSTSPGNRRSKRGQQLVEFSCVFVLLVCGIAIPLLNLGIVPIRWALSYSFLENSVRNLARCETFSEALRTNAQDNSMDDALASLGGVTVDKAHLYLQLHSEKRGTKEIDMPGKVPQEWLKGDSQVFLTRCVEISISPLITSRPFGLKIEGVNSPVKVCLVASSPWENLSKNPLTCEYFVNE